MSYERNDNTGNRIMIYGALFGYLLGHFIVKGVRSCNCNHPLEDAGVHTSITAMYTDIKEFNPGEHIISVPYKEIEKRVVQDKSIPRELPYHPGYKVVGMSNGSILYVNSEKVTCTSTDLDKNNNYVYDKFGIPEGYTIPTNEETDRKVFGIGEHVVLRPITDPKKEMRQYTYVEGYEVIDISAQSSDDIYEGGYVVYRNISPVECTKTEKGFNNFGKVVKEKTLVLKQ